MGKWGLLPKSPSWGMAGKPSPSTRLSGETGGGSLLTLGMKGFWGLWLAEGLLPPLHQTSPEPLPLTSMLPGAEGPDSPSEGCVGDRGHGQLLPH